MAETANLQPFKPGQSGNPGGRPKLPAEVRELARGYSVLAIETLAAVMQDGAAPAAAKVSAASTILDRAWGKPSQPLDGDGEGGAIRQTVEIRFVKPGET